LTFVFLTVRPRAWRAFIGGSLRVWSAKPHRGLRGLPSTVSAARPGVGSAAALDALAVTGEQGEAALTSGPAPLFAAGWCVQAGPVLPGVAGGTTVWIDYAGCRRVS